MEMEQIANLHFTRQLRKGVRSVECFVKRMVYLCFSLPPSNRAGKIFIVFLHDSKVRNAQND